MILLLAESPESRQEAESHGQSLQEAIFSWTVVSAGSKRSRSVSAEANLTDSLCRKRKLADSFIPCDYSS